MTSASLFSISTSPVTTQANISLERLKVLQAELEQALGQNEVLLKEREQYRDLYLAALEQIKKLERGILGQKAERVSEEGKKQLSLALLEMMLGDKTEPEPNGPVKDSAEDDHANEEDGPDDPKPAPKPRGRRRLPRELPRVEIEVLPPEVQAEGLNAYERIGEESSESVENRPASKVVVRVVRPKFKRKTPSTAEAEEERTEILVAETPELPIPRSIAGPGMLADSVVKRWQDHIPLNRQEGIYGRDGLDIHRSTISGWHKKLGDLAAPVVKSMFADALENSPYLCTDATGVLVREKEKCRNGHFWVLVAPKRHVLYQYTPKHNGAAVDKMLKGYRGYLVADAHVVYDHLFEGEDIVEVACWAHTRRYAFKALDSDPERGRKALGLINALFRIERENKMATSAKKKAIREQKSRPLVERYFEWCHQEKAEVLSETPIAKLIGYSTNQETALCRFLEDGRLPLHNNISELNLRRQVLGRKNWLFLGNDAGGETNATFVSLLASCQIHDIEPHGYLRDVFCLLPSWPAKRVLELAPAFWKQTLEQEDTKRELDANIYRQVSLGIDNPTHLPAA